MFGGLIKSQPNRGRRQFYNDNDWSLNSRWKMPQGGTDRTKPQKSRQQKNQGVMKGPERMRVQIGSASTRLTLTAYAGLIYLFRFQSYPCEVLLTSWPCVQSSVLEVVAFYSCYAIFLFCICYVFLCLLLGARQSRWAISSKPPGRFFSLVCFVYLVCVSLRASLQRPCQVISNLACLAQLSVARLGLTLITLSCSFSWLSQLPSVLPVLCHFELCFVICSFTRSVSAALSSWTVFHQPQW